MDLSTSLHQSPKVQALVSKLHQKWEKDKSWKKAKWANFVVVEGAVIVTAKAQPAGNSLSWNTSGHVGPAIMQFNLDILMLAQSDLNNSKELGPERVHKKDCMIG